ncbi:MAG TPA: hypothetical protein VMW24_02100 [Sedimentisphaerales bacterium]|nr:hypothetical protein [Sedimentisphaerales bacterium]
MKFAALFGKEFRECLPWMLLAAIVLLAFGSFFLRAQAYDMNPNRDWSRGYNPPGTAVEAYRLTFNSPLAMLGPWLFCCSIGLGLILGARQFWIPNFTRTWPFLLHRSARRTTILTAKLTAGSTALVLAIGGVWVSLYWYACQLEVFTVPPPARVFIHGWILVIMGLLTYLGTALSGLSEARWYTTKIFGIAFAVIIVGVTTGEWSLARALAVIAFGAALLLSQLFDTFATREF